MNNSFLVSQQDVDDARVKISIAENGDYITSDGMHFTKEDDALHRQLNINKEETGEKTLSKKLKDWRADRPDEWKMDEFIRDAHILEGRPTLSSILKEYDNVSPPKVLMDLAITGQAIVRFYIEDDTVKMEIMNPLEFNYEVPK